MALKMQKTHKSISRTAPPSYDVVTASRPPNDAALVESATAWISNPLAIHNARVPRLEKPVVIPRIDTSGRLAVPLPFMRVYSPDLRQHGISEEDFVAFVDNLAVAQAPPAPLQILSVTGQAVGFVPHHWAVFAGAGINVAAGMGTAAVSYGRTRFFLEKVNREYFAPRGLHMLVCKYQQLVKKLAIGPDVPVRIDRDPQAGIISVRDRCVSAVQPYVADLSFDVPPPSGERNVLDKLAAKGIERRRRKQDEKHRKKFEKDGYSSDSSSSSSSSSSSGSSSEEDKAQRKAARRVRKIDRRARKDLRKHPGRAAEIEQNRERKVQQVMIKPIRDIGKGAKSMTKKLKKDLDQVKRLEFIVVQALIERHLTA
ncbi:hypothetical protein E8E11_005380 [Didymella keratinophila]|nr:hypothetical protein E8E11_005380 [Didymella keratinophila]